MNIKFTLLFHRIKDATCREKLLIQPWAFDLGPRLETHERELRIMNERLYVPIMFVDVFHTFLGYLQVS